MTLIAPSTISNDKGAQSTAIIPGPGDAAANGVAVTWWWKGDVTHFSDWRRIMAISTSSTANRFAVDATLSGGNRVLEGGILKTGGFGAFRTGAVQSLTTADWNLFGFFMPPGTGTRTWCNGTSSGTTFSNLSGNGVTADTTLNFWWLRNPSASGRAALWGSYLDINIWSGLPLTADFNALCTELLTVDPQSVSSDANLLHRWKLTTSLARTAGSGTLFSGDGAFVLDTGGTPLTFDADDTDWPAHLYSVDTMGGTRANSPHPFP